MLQRFESIFIDVHLQAAILKAEIAYYHDRLLPTSSAYQLASRCAEIMDYEALDFDGAIHGIVEITMDAKPDHKGKILTLERLQPREALIEVMRAGRGYPISW